MARHLRGPLTADLRSFADPDDQGDAAGFYTVQSLYLDSVDWRCFYEKRAGLSRRHKQRIRCYPQPGTPISTVKFEVKHRQGSRIGKTVAAVTTDEYRIIAEALRARRAGSLDLSRFAPALTPFVYLAVTHGMTPVINVRFRRQAFTGRIDRGVRITFDDRLVARPARDLFEPMPPARVSLGGQQSILEIKTERAVPFCCANSSPSIGCSAVRSASTTTPR